MRLFGEALHGLRHAAEEEGLGLLLAAVTIRVSNQFLGLWDGDRSKEIWKDWLQRSAQPDVEEVRKIGVANVVVVWCICRNTLADAESLYASVTLQTASRRTVHKLIKNLTK